MRTKILIAVASVTISGLGMLAVQQALVLKRAHSTFENYVAFRGCTQLLKRAGGYGICRVASGGVIKIVQVHGRWYLAGDLPWCPYWFC